MESTSVEFVVPDQSLARMVLPLSPTLCFVHESETEILNGLYNVVRLNQLLIDESSAYYFGRTLPK